MYEVVKHVYENNDCYGIDKTRISVGGRSIGAYLALGACMLMANRDQTHMVKALFLSAPILTDVMVTTPDSQLRDYEREPSKRQWTETFKILSQDFVQ